MGLREIESKLPPGFRFYPSDEELVCHYLLKKISKERVSEGTLVEVDLHTCEPWELPDVAKLSANEWYFFSFRDRKYSTGSRTNRATKTGYWKATGKDRVVHDPTSQAVVGMRKTLVFYGGRAPNGIKTNWVMHEFRLETPHMPTKEDWVLCRVLSKRKSETTSYGQENENQENYSTNYTSPNILEYSSLFGQQTVSTAVNYVDQVTPLTTFLPQIEDNNANLSNKSPLMALLQYNFLGEMEMEYINRHEDDCGFLVDMGLGEHYMTGSSSNHGIDTVCTKESNVVDMNTC